MYEWCTGTLASGCNISTRNENEQATTIYWKDEHEEEFCYGTCAYTACVCMFHPRHAGTVSCDRVGDRYVRSRSGDYRRRYLGLDACREYCHQDSVGVDTVLRIERPGTGRLE